MPAQCVTSKDESRASSQDANGKKTHSILSAWCVGIDDYDPPITGCVTNSHQMDAECATSKEIGNKLRASSQDANGRHASSIQFCQK